MSINVTISSIQLAINSALETLNGACEKALAPVNADEIASAESSLAHAQEAQAQMNEGAGAILAVIENIQTALANRTLALRNELKTQALGRVASLVQSGALSLADVAAALGLDAAAVGAVADAPKATGASSGKYMNPDKYRNPHTGETWSGRGPAPKWLKALAVDGKTIEDFRVDAPANTKPAAAAAAPASTANAATTPAAAAPQAESPAPAAMQTAGPAASSDIGETVSFDANLDDDIDGHATSFNRDIGEMLSTMQTDGAGAAHALGA